MHYSHVRTDATRGLPLNVSFLHVCTALVIMFSFLGCGSSVVTVRRDIDGQIDGTDGHTTSVGGVPFYIKSSFYHQTTSYLFTWYRVQLIKRELKDDKEVVRYERNVPSSQLARIDRLKSWVAGKLTDASFRQATSYLIDSLTALSNSELYHPDGKYLVTIGNTCEQEVVTDYSHRYYINGTIPFMGSNTLETEVAEDGTLSKGGGTAVNGLKDIITAATGAVTGILPIKEALQVKWAGAASKDSSDIQDFMVAPPRRGSKPLYRAELNVEEMGTVFDFIRDSKDPQCSVAVPVDFLNGTFSRRDLAQEQDNNEDNPPAFKIEGSITPPK